MQWHLARLARIAPSTLRLSLLCVFAINTSASAQSAPKASTTPDSATALVGTWEGSYTSDHAPAGAMKLVIGKDSALKISSFAVSMNNEMTEIATRGFAVASTDISWTQDLMGMPCGTTAILKDGQMRGTMVCGHGSVTFALTKK